MLFPRTAALTLTVALALTALLAGLADAVTVVLEPSADGQWRRSSSTTTLFGSSTSLRAGRDKSGSTWLKERTILQFDLDGIDLDRIESATLNMTYLSGRNTHNYELWYSNLDSWAESGTSLTGVPVGGLPLSQQLAMFNNTGWTANQRITWDLMTLGWNMATDVADGTVSFLLKINNSVGGEDTMSTQRYLNFASGEYVNPVGLNYHPTLEFVLRDLPPEDNTMPEPLTATAALLSAAGLGRYVRRRRRAN